jgi:hypothetical protein
MSQQKVDMIGWDEISAQRGKSRSARKCTVVSLPVVSRFPPIHLKSSAAMHSFIAIGIAIDVHRIVLFYC